MSAWTHSRPRGRADRRRRRRYRKPGARHGINHASPDECSSGRRRDLAAGLWTTGRPDDPRRGTLGRYARGSQSSAVAPSPDARADAPSLVYVWVSDPGDAEALRDLCVPLLSGSQKIKNQRGGLRPKCRAVSRRPVSPGALLPAGHRPVARSPEVRDCLPARGPRRSTRSRVRRSLRARCRSRRRRGGPRWPAGRRRRG
jgi:hypothetical protein